jgi:hypothetical protein
MGGEPGLINSLYSVIPWPLLGEAALDYQVWCGSGLYSSRSSFCIGTEGKGEKKRHISGKAAQPSIFS